MGRPAREMGRRPERRANLSKKQSPGEQAPRPTYSEAAKTAREVSKAFENKASQAKIAQIREAIHGEAIGSLGTPKATTVDRGYANAVNEQAKANVLKEYKDLGNEVGLSITDLKMLEGKYDRFSAQEKAAAGLPEHFDQIATTTGKKPPTSAFGKFLSRFSGASARAELFDKARDFLANNNPDSLANPEGGAASSRFAAGKKQSSKIDRSGMGGLQ